MAGSAAPEPKPDLGWKATVAGLVFSATIVAGFGVATATNFEDSFKDKDKDKTEVSEDYEEGENEEEGSEE